MLTTSNFTKLLAKMVQTAPLTHCITNSVVTNFTANVLLAVGASPAMVVAKQESGDFAKIATALLINIGTVTSSQSESMLVAAAAAHHANTAWVLDPVAYGPLTFRNEICQQLLQHKPSVIRGNAAEIAALAGENIISKGADSSISSDAALDSAKLLARQQQCIVAVTGKIDYVTNGEQVYALQHGHLQLTRVTGTGCALSALVAAFCGICDDKMLATLAALAQMSIAGQVAAAQTNGAGSFAVALLDNLQNTTQLLTQVEIKCREI